MGLHTGEPRVTDGGYVGIDVHKGARIAAAARRVDRYPHGVHFVPLASVASPDFLAPALAESVQFAVDGAHSGFSRRTSCSTTSANGRRCSCSTTSSISWRAPDFWARS